MSTSSKLSETFCVFAGAAHGESEKARKAQTMISLKKVVLRIDKPSIDLSLSFLYYRQFILE
jgi:hypothetical protein